MNIIKELKDFIMGLEAKLQADPEVQKVEAEVKTVVKATATELKAIAGTGWNYIANHGLQALYALAQEALLAMQPGVGWTTLLVQLGKDAVQKGVKIVEGAEAVVAAQAQADLIAAGKLPAPDVAAKAAANDSSAV